MLNRILIPIFGAAVTGVFSATGLAAPQDILSVGDTSLSLSANNIDFFSNAGAGTFDVGSTSTGAFANLGGTSGTIQNLSVTTGSVSVSNFLSIPTLPTAQFNLTSINPGIFLSAGCSSSPPAVGQTCTVPGTPLNFINTPTGTVVSFSASGQVINTSTSAANNFTATFSTQFAGQFFQNVLATLGTAGLEKAPFATSINVPSGSFAGTLNAGQPSISLTSTNIGFSPTQVTIGSTSTGAFAALSGTTATIQNLGIVAGSVSISNFLTITGHPELEFDLSTIVPGIFSTAGCAATPPALGQDCTLPMSSLNFLNTSLTSSLLFFSLTGTAMDTATAQQTPFEATFMTEFNQPYQILLGDLANGGTIDASYSVEFAAGPFGAIVAASEPGSLTLLVASFAVFALWYRRRSVED